MACMSAFLFFFLFAWYTVLAQGPCGADYTDPCYANCTSFSVVDPASPCFVNCSTVAYTDLASPCYACDPNVNCYPIGGSCGSVPSDPCSCNYGFTLDNCTVALVTPGDAGYQFLVWFLGVTCMVVLALYALGLLAYLVWAMPRANVLSHRNMPILTTICCFIACTMRIFYYVPDPYAFGGTRTGCSSWSIDYFSTYFVSIAFATVCWQWVTIVSKINTSKSARMQFAKRFLTALKVFLLVEAVVQLMCAIAASVMSCYCDGVTCPYQASDYLYWITWQVFNGIAIIACIVNAVLVITGLRQFKTRHQRRIRFFTLFIMGISMGMALLLGYTISLLLDYASSTESFLAAESLEQSFIVVVMLSILVLLTVTRRGTANASNSLAAHASTKESNSRTNTGADKDTASDVFSPSHNISVLEYERDEEEDAEVAAANAAAKAMAPDEQAKGVQKSAVSPRGETAVGDGVVIL